MNHRKKFPSSVLSRPATSQGIPSAVPSPTSSADSAASTSTNPPPSAFSISHPDFPRITRHIRPRSSSATFMHTLSVGNFAGGLSSASSFADHHQASQSTSAPASAQGSSSHHARHSTVNLSRSPTRSSGVRQHSISSTSRQPTAYSTAHDSSTAVTECSQPAEKKRSDRPKSYFVKKNAKKHHAFDDTVPYPVSYERRVLDQCVLGAQCCSPLEACLIHLITATFGIQVGASSRVLPRSTLKLLQKLCTWIFFS